MVVVAQLGARMHYAVPALFARSGMLERLYTDIYAPSLPEPIRGWLSRFGPAPLRRWIGRVPEDIPEEKIISFCAMGLEYYRRQWFASAGGSAISAHLWAGQEFCRSAIKKGLGNARTVYTFNSAGLELLEFAKNKGLFTVSEQTSAPSRIYSEIVNQEEATYRRWTASQTRASRALAFEDRERMEWEAADLIVCGSEFVRQGIRRIGGPAERCCIVPYGVRQLSPLEERTHRHRPLRVLVVGSVQLMKGPQYVMAAAKILKGQAEIRIAGQLGITSFAQDLLSKHVTLLGAVPRSDIHRQFAWADVFLLPTLCEGSATVCYEALSHGLPVITTANAGSVVRDGIDGFVVPIRDSAAIADRLERLADNDDLWAAMAAHARDRASEYTLDRYEERLLSALQQSCQSVN
jgi:glycosyltransferase involved in cell wall biosynthesis